MSRRETLQGYVKNLRESLAYRLEDDQQLSSFELWIAEQTPADLYRFALESASMSPVDFMLDLYMVWRELQRENQMSAAEDLVFCPKCEGKLAVNNSRVAEYENMLTTFRHRVCKNPECNWTGYSKTMEVPCPSDAKGFW